jgi:hypothetical protein
MKRFTAVALILLFAMVAISCGTVQTQRTGYSAYVMASNEFTGLVNQYTAYYQTVGPQTQAEWKAKFDPIFVKANETFDVWRQILDSGGDTAGQIQAYNAIKSRLVQLLLSMADKTK